MEIRRLPTDDDTERATAVYERQGFEPSRRRLTRSVE
jgi:hypothetical protein